MSLKYDIVKNLGKGVYGTVFEVRETQSGDIYAAKVARDSNSRTIMSNEIIIHSHLNHPNIVKFVSSFDSMSCGSGGITPMDHGLKGNCRIMILEICRGGTLEALMKVEKKVSLQKIRRIAHKIASGLNYLKTKNVIHGDLKPENIIFGVGGTKIIDFGLSKVTTSIDPKVPTIATGTPYYMPLEGFDGKYSFATDVFSLGVVLFRMCNGRFPFPADTQKRLITMLTFGKFRFSAETTADADLKNLITKMLETDIDKRITIEEVLKHDFFNPDSNDEDLSDIFSSMSEPGSLEWFKQRKNDFGDGSVEQFYLYLAVTVDPHVQLISMQDVKLIWNQL